MSTPGPRPGQLPRAPGSGVPRPPRDPRDIITPDAFTVAPDLLGLPLAGGGRRLAAMLLDLLLILLLTQAGGLLLAVAGAFVLWKATAKRRSPSLLGRSMRLMMRGTAAFMLFVTLLIVWFTWPPWGADDGAEAGNSVDGRRLAGPPGVMSAVALLDDLHRLRQSRTEADALPHAARLAERMRNQGVDLDDIDVALRELEQDEDVPPLPPHAIAALRRALAPPTVAAPPDSLASDADSLTSALAAAIAARDSTTADSLRSQLTLTLAADTLTRLQSRLDDLGTARHDLAVRSELLADSLRAAREGVGLVTAIRSLGDDLGLSLGWSGLYFTAFLALWRGHTPGKRVLGTRVLRLDGRPIGWWIAFERFGGYGAGLATGLLGFFQILWDPNRQAIHDKITGTVVVLERQQSPDSAQATSPNSRAAARAPLRTAPSTEDDTR